MKLIVEMSSLLELEKLLDSEPFIVKGNENVDPTELFGILKDNPRTLEEIREKAWKGNWTIKQKIQ